MVINHVWSNLTCACFFLYGWLNHQLVMICWGGPKSQMHGERWRFVQTTQRSQFIYLMFCLYVHVWFQILFICKCLHLLIKNESDFSKKELFAEDRKSISLLLGMYTSLKQTESFNLPSLDFWASDSQGKYPKAVTRIIMFFSGDSNLISTFTGILAGFHVRVPGTSVANIYTEDV